MRVKEFFEELWKLSDTKCQVNYSGEFKKNLKLAYKRGFDLELLLEVVHVLAKHEELAEKYKPHVLKGEFEGIWECHIKTDWLLLWDWQDDKLVLMLVSTGTHSDLF